MNQLRRSLDATVRGASLVILDRRWAGPLAGMALGFGIFVGVAVGPQTVGSLATTAQVIVEAPADEPAPAPQARTGGADRGSRPDSRIPSGSSAPDLLAPVLPPSAPLAPAPPPAEPAPATPSEPTEPAEEPPDAEQTLAGVVAHVNEASGSYTLAAGGGALYGVHTKRLPKPGTKQRVPVRQLANGTYGEDGEVEVLGKQTAAELAGTVTFVDDSPSDPGYAISSAGTSALVHVEPTGDGTVPELPELGAFGLATVSLKPAPKADEQSPADPTAPGTAPPTTPPTTVSTTTTTTEPSDCPVDPAAAGQRIAPAGILVERGFDAEGEPSSFSDFAGIVKAVCPESGELVISADDIDEAGGELLFAVGDDLDPTAFKLGDSIAATATIEENGSLSMSGLASDEQLKGADDADLAQGDLAR